MKREQAAAGIVEKGAVQIHVRWGSSEQLETIYVNHLIITRTGPEFYLVFGELAVPAVMRPEDVPKEVLIVPKVRLAISPKAMEPIARVIQENLQSFLQKEE